MSGPRNRRGTCRAAFIKVAAPKPPKQSASPLSLRLTSEERSRLEDDAAGLSLSAYVRQRLFESEAAPRRTRGKSPVKDHQALARVLAALGRSELTMKLEVLRYLLEDAPEHWTPEDSAILRDACADVKAMRSDLMTALGLRSV